MRNQREIDFPDMIYYVLSKWKVLLIALVIGFVLVGGYNFCTTRKNANVGEDSGTKEQTASVEEVKKRAEITKLEGKLRTAEMTLQQQEQTLEKAAVAEGKVEQLQDYISGSILMNLDPSDFAEAFRVYHVSLSDPLSVDPLLVTDLLDEITTAYVIQTGLTEEQLSKYPYAEKYINELISYSTNIAANTVTVSVYADSEELAKKILEDACATLEGRKQELENNIAKHELEAVTEKVGRKASYDLATVQNNNISRLNSWKSQAVVSKSTEELEGEVAVLNANIREAEEELQKIVKSGIVEEKKFSIKDVLKFGLLGGIVLALVFAAVYFLIYVFDGRIHSVKEIGHCFGLALLVGLNAPFKKGCRLDKFFYRLRNKNAGTSNEVMLQTAAVAIGKLLGEAKTVAILSSLNEQALEKVTAGLSESLTDHQFIAVADSNSSVAAAEKLKEADAVIVYEMRDVSRVREIEAEYHQANLMEKKIIGCIVG